MKRQVLIITLLLIGVGCGDDSPRIETREIPLPDLLGNYGPSENGDQRTVGIQLGGTATVVRSVEIRIGGTTTPGVVRCVPDNEPRPYPMGFSASMDADPGWWSTGGGLPDSSFSRTWRFRALVGATFDFLLDGETDLTFTANPPGLPHFPCSIVSLPTATIDQAVLIVEADFAVPVQTLTFGQIKAPY